MAYERIGSRGIVFGTMLGTAGYFAVSNDAIGSVAMARGPIFRITGGGRR